jgi:hypothetical protein
MNLARDGGLVGGARTFEFRFKFSKIVHSGGTSSAADGKAPS